MNRILPVLALLGCNVWLFAGPPLTKSHSEGKFSDAEIEATIKAKLSKSKIGKDGFQVHVKDRVATWTGSTGVMQHKGAATRMAKAAGAIQVLNNIKVAGDGGLPRRVQVNSTQTKAGQKASGPHDAQHLTPDDEP